MTPLTPERFSAAWRLRLRYHADRTTFVVMRELKLQRVLTGDTHFEQVGFGFVRLPGTVRS